MDKVIIQNMDNIHKTFNLLHQRVCVKHGRCLCDSKTGSCMSVHIAALNRCETTSAALLLEDIREEVETGRLVVYKVKSGLVPPKQIVEKEEKKTKPAGRRKSNRKREKLQE